MNQKLIIEAYKSIEYKGGEKLGSITVQINPDSYKLSKSTSYKKDESIKEDKQLPEYKHTNPSTLSFDIHFDGTGIIPTGKKTWQKGSRIWRISFFFLARRSIHPALASLK